MITPALERVLQALEHQSNVAVVDIAAQAFVGVSTLACGGYLRTLRACRLIHVSGWRKVNGRFSTPLCSAGDNHDVKPTRIDETKRSAPGMARIHIVQWCRSCKGQMSPVHVAGPGLNAPKAAVPSQEERNRRHRLRQEARVDGAEQRMQLAGLMSGAWDGR